MILVSREHGGSAGACAIRRKMVFALDDRRQRGDRIDLSAILEPADGLDAVQVFVLHYLYLSFSIWFWVTRQVQVQVQVFELLDLC